MTKRRLHIIVEQPNEVRRPFFLLDLSIFTSFGCQTVQLDHFRGYEDGRELEGGGWERREVGIRLREAVHCLRETTRYQGIESSESRVQQLVRGQR